MHFIIVCGTRESVNSTMIPVKLIIAVLFLLGAAECLPLSESADSEDSADTKDSRTLITSDDNDGSEDLVASDDADKDLTKSNIISPDKTNSGSSALTQVAISPEILQLLQLQGGAPAAATLPGLPAGFGLPAANPLQALLQPQPAPAPASLSGFPGGGFPVGFGIPGANPLQSLLQANPAAAPAPPPGINPALLALLQPPPGIPQAAPIIAPPASPLNPLAALLGGNPVPAAAPAPNPLAGLGGLNLAALGLGQQQPALSAPPQPDLAAVLAALQGQGAAVADPDAEGDERFGMWGMGMYNPYMWMYG